MLRRIVLKQGSHPVVRMVYQRDGRGKGPVVCAFRRHSLTHSHYATGLTKNLRSREGMMRVGRSMTAGLSCSLADLESS